MTMLINAASKEQRWVMAVQLLQLMRSYNIEPNNVTYTAILSEMSRFKQVRDTFGICSWQSKAPRGQQNW